MNRKGKLWIITGMLLLLCAALLTGYNIIENFRADNYAETAVFQLEKSIEETVLEKEDFIENNPLSNPDREMPVETVNGHDYIGILNIPALNIEIPVISYWDYASLKVAPCRYYGSVYQKNMVLCGHNYASHFGGLKNLHIGDQIHFSDMDGNEFKYQVVELETLNADHTEEMLDGEWDLTLFTCTIGGEKRVTVRCEQLEG